MKSISLHYFRYEKLFASTKLNRRGCFRVADQLAAFRMPITIRNYASNSTHILHCEVRGELAVRAKLKRGKVRFVPMPSEMAAVLRRSLRASEDSRSFEYQDD